MGAASGGTIALGPYLLELAGTSSSTSPAVGELSGASAVDYELADAPGDAIPPTQMFVTRYGHGTRELIDCSGRGLCDGGSGVCACFKGYTGDDCSAQNALAM